MMSSLRFLQIASVALLAACAKPGLPPPEPIIRTVEIMVPIDDPACARAALAEAEETVPDYPDTDGALANVQGIFQAIQLYKAGRGLRITYTETLLDSLRECAR